MPVIVVYEQPELKRYYVHCCSIAAAATVLLFAFSILAPFGILYVTSDAWPETTFYYEQPLVQFKEHYASIYTQDGDQIACTSNHFIKESFGVNYRPCPFKLRLTDNNTDGLLDNFTLTVDVPLFDNEQISSMDWFIVLYYRLFKFSNFTMEAMIHMNTFASSNSSGVQIEGALELLQEELLNTSGQADYYNVSVFSNTSQVSDYLPTRILSSYQERAVRVKTGETFQSWNDVSRLPGEPFTFTAGVKIPLQKIYRKTTFGFKLITWLQFYIPLLVISVYVVNMVLAFLFDNQIVMSHVAYPL